MTDNRLLNDLIQEYYSSRPNLNVHHNPLCVFFVACSGAGKSTIRRLLVEKLGATYVCNDEVRLLLKKYPESNKQGIELKDIIAGVVKKIFAEAHNKLVIYDNSIIQYYMHADSYLNVAKTNRLPVCIIGLSATIEKLEERIRQRNINVPFLLNELPQQIRAYDAALKDIVPDRIIKITGDNDELKDLVQYINTVILAL